MRDQGEVMKDLMSEKRPFEVGDEVYAFSTKRIVPTVIERVTKTQVVTAAGGKYQRVGGIMVGRDTWSTARIEHPSPQLNQRYAAQCLSAAGTGLVYAVERGTPSEIHAAYTVWAKLEKEVNGE